MAAIRYVLVILLLAALALVTVSEQVERTRLGYRVRELEQARRRLAEREKSARLAFERAAAPERLVERALALRVAPADELRALPGADE